MKQSKTATFKGRYLVLNILLAVCFLGLTARMIKLTVIDREFLQRQGDARTIRTVSTPAYRGMITDRHGVPLAVSTPVDAIWISPRDFSWQAEQLPQLAKLLHTSVAHLSQVINDNTTREFVYLKRGVSPDLARRIQRLKIPGVNVRHEFRRYYPEGESTAHLLGFTDIDDHGQEGMELAYDAWLTGKSGKKRVLKDRVGRIIEDLATLQEPMPGNNLTLSIDRRIQYLAYKALKQATELHKAQSGSVVVLDVRSGEVLALVNSPSFNPNATVHHHSSAYRNRALTDVFEPGSVIKAFSVASALASGKFTPETVINTAPGYIHLTGNTIRDGHHHGKLTVTEVMQRSSNVGVTKMVLANPPQTLLNLYQAVGFGQRTGTQFPGESAGFFVAQKNWQPFSLATLGFGYGLSVTAVQLAQAYAIFANHGELKPVSLLRRQQLPAGKQVLSAKAADEMLAILIAVVEQGGTGRLARIPYYKVAGKTGTARKVGRSGYVKDHHIATFVGIAPADKPKLLVLVVINDPQKGSYYGGRVAAPLFARVMRHSLRVLNVFPSQAQEARQ